MSTNNSSLSKLTFSGWIVTLGIVFGDIGTSPLYVMKAITAANNYNISENLIIGALSCIIWTLTLQTTVKYVMIALKVDNKGEGGILALYSLVKRNRKKFLYIIAIIGASTLVADGVITPSMTVITAVEGLEGLSHDISSESIIFLTVIILVGLFVVQRHGTDKIGKFYGPVMGVWFLMLAITGLSQMFHFPRVFLAFNPYYAIELIINAPSTLLIMGAVFLCTTGAEALYSDLGHCGAKNIRASWVFVKICLILNYLGQGAWILTNPDTQAKINPFFKIMPEWFLIPGILMATLAAVIASQALITGSFTIFSEAMSLNFWPREKINYPTKQKGQMYIPDVNWALMIMCLFMVFYFKHSSQMEAAYGLAITVTMLATSILLVFYLIRKKTNPFLIGLFALVYFTIEGGFFYANILKFYEGGWVTMLIAGAISFIMYVWYNGRRLKNKYIQYVKMEPYVPIIQDMINDNDIPKYSSQLVYISRSKIHDEIEAKIIYSIINNSPKRADVYWFLSVENDINPYTFEYEVIEIIPQAAFKVFFKLGFKVNPMINVYFNQVLEDLSTEGKVNLCSNYASLKKYNIPADMTFIITDRVISLNYLNNIREEFILYFYELVKKIGISDTKALGLEKHNVVIEQAPLLTEITIKNKIKRTYNL